MVSFEPSEKDIKKLQETAVLINRIKNGESEAYTSLFNRFYPYLLDFLHTKINPTVCNLSETQDFIQDVFIQSYPYLKRFEYRGIGSLWAYLRQIAVNLVRQHYKSKKNKPPITPLIEDSKRAPSKSGNGPLEDLLHKEEFEAYEKALTTLSNKEKSAFILRMDLKLPYKMIAKEAGYPSSDAARMAIIRAFKKVHKEVCNGIL